jgi:hypothetical protein
MFKSSVRIGISRRVTLPMAGLLVTTFVGLGSSVGVANADIVVITPEPNVSSEQADSVSQNATQGKVRGAKPNEVHAHGEVRDSVKATPNRKHRADPFKLGPPMRLGEW